MGEQMESVVDRCRALTSVREPELEDLKQALSGGDAAEALALATADARHPYGRRVFLETDEVEGMIARWTRAFPCAPHDHGGSVGAVRVLSGEVVHRMWEVRDGALRLAAEERRGPGDILTCGPHLVHSMMDGGAADPLVTLHVYTRPIDHMVVYDTAAARTLIVQGKCGAWVPLDAPELVRTAVDGIVAIDDLPGA